MAYTKQRGAFGKVAEDTVAAIFKSKGVTYENTKNFSCWSPLYDKEHGDLHIATPWGQSKKELDVKRGGISIDSINSFKGDYFVLCDKDLNHMIVFPAAAMRKYLATCLKNGSGTKQLSSGDWGIGLNPYKLVRLKTAVSVEKWIDNGFKI